VHLRKGEQRGEAFLALNPQGLVPALETDGRVITQSLAIIEWLEETLPSPPLLPADPADRAYVRSLAYLLAADTHPLTNLRVLNHLRSDLGQDQAGVDRWCRHWIETGLKACDAMLARSPRPGRFAFGDAPTLADICLAPQFFSAARFGADVASLENVQRVHKACEALPAFADAHPSRQPDFEP
jgi:maleylacetoacetate isomerase